MGNCKSVRTKSVYDTRRYWYHLSTTLKHKAILLKPWDNSQGFNRTYNEPNDRRICVAPTIAQCITALPYWPGDIFRVYRTKSKVKANPPRDIFDANITQEGWIQKPTIFVRIGDLELEDVERGEGLGYIIDQAASDNSPQRSGRVLKWWSKYNLWKYLKRT
jgi:hypothetical protein